MIEYAWPAESLGDALNALLRRSGMPANFAQPLDGSDLEIERLAAHFRCEAEPVETTFGELEHRLATCAPAMLRLPGGGWLAILKSTKRTQFVLTPQLHVRRLPLAALCDALRDQATAPQRKEVLQLLQDAGVASSRQPNALALILREQDANKPFTGRCWSLRVPPGAAILPWLSQVDALRNGFVLAGAHTVQYLLWVASFWIAGQAALSGRVDRGWLLAWALILMTLIPFRLLTTLLQGRIAIGVGGLLKQRLLAGTLKLAPDEMRNSGIGHFLGQALEAETVETLAINGGIAGLLAILELVVAGAILGSTAWLLAAWLALTLALAWRFLKRYRVWTRTRMEMTHGLVERMVGNRTRLAQQPRDQWHEDEDAQVENYVAVSKALDGSGAWLIAGAPRGWLLVGVAALGPSFVSGQAAPATLAVGLGGTLLAYTAFRRLTGSLSDIAAAWVAWIQVASLFQAAARDEAIGGAVPVDDGAPAKIEAESIAFRYRDLGSPVLEDCSLVIHPGDRILVEGPSGGGKSTLGAILSGLRRPESGVLLCGGLDFQTLGLDRWRKRIATAPQFHENHVLTETLAFNLLMGRRWPPLPTDMAEAEALCVQLGLGDLVERMPGGMLQMIGEGGWQLSHGERSRVFMARALLQGAGTVILDESFAALDPESLRVALECALDRAQTLVVIAHP